ncbi:MAG: hypothetical protein JNK45_13085 [Myxococcales bacterium]|nr:hypothetical protein [Myxococcales bacterium]
MRHGHVASALAWSLSACGDAESSASGAGTTQGGTDQGAAASSSGAEASSGSAAPDTGDVAGSETGDAPGPWTQGQPIPPGEPPTGDPEAGRVALLERGYVSCGIPYPLFALAQPLLGAFASEPPLPGRTGKNALVPYNWTVHVTDSGAEIASLNCLECHAGRFDGELVIGLGRADADYTQNLGELLGGVPIPDLPIPGLDELARFAQRYQVLGPAITMNTVGTNPADEVAVVLAAHRDQQTLAWSDTPHSEIPDLVAPVDTPPWWRVKKKHGLFYNGMARGDHRGTMMFASSLCTDSVEEAQEILDYFDDIRAYVASIEAPAYPFAIDHELAEVGGDVFAAACAGCHGTYAGSDEQDTYPNLVFGLDVIGTDPLVAEYAMNSPLIDWFNGSVYGQVTELVVDDPLVGYTAPPLDGIWATAPFFHNGSVPSLALVIDSTARPERWKRVDYDSTHFDEAALGWPWLSVPYPWADAPDAERKFVYDTTLQGHGNGGHEFGDMLSDDERVALLEYLKTL